MVDISARAVNLPYSKHSSSSLPTLFNLSNLVFSFHYLNISSIFHLTLYISHIHLALSISSVGFVMRMFHLSSSRWMSVSILFFFSASIQAFRTLSLAISSGKIIATSLVCILLFLFLPTYTWVSTMPLFDFLRISKMLIFCNFPPLVACSM